MALAAPSIDEAYALEDRYRKERGRVLITGTQALVRLPMAQRRLDRARGLRTAGFVSGYRGSPVAGYDLALRQAQKLLEAEDVRFVPGINEELAAAAVMGSQQVEAEGRGRFDGVFAIWYGKGPGLDRAGDAIKHGHAYGTSPHGGVLCVVGDDHGAVSSTVAHQSDQSFAAWSMPVLHPASVRDYLELGLWGWAAVALLGRLGRLQGDLGDDRERPGLRAAGRAARLRHPRPTSRRPRTGCTSAGATRPRSRSRPASSTSWTRSAPSPVPTRSTGSWSRRRTRGSASSRSARPTATSWRRSRPSASASASFSTSACASSRSR